MGKIIGTLKSFWGLLKKLITILDKKQRLQSLFLLFGVFVCASLETLGVSAVIPFVLVLFSPETMLENDYIKKIADIFNATDYHKLLFITAFLIVAVYLLKNAVLLFFKYFQGKFHNDIECSLTIKQYRMFMLRPYAFYLNTNTSDVIRGITNDTVQVAQVIDGFIGIFSEGFTVLMIGIFVVCMDPMMAFGLIGTAVLLVLIFALGFKKKTTELGIICRDVFSAKNKSVMESVSGYKEISVYQKKDHFVDEYSKISQYAAKKNTINLFIMKVPYCVIETVFIASLLGLTCLKISMGGDSAQFASMVGTLVVAAIRILPSISNVSNSINILTYNRMGLEAAYENTMQVQAEEEAYIMHRDNHKDDDIFFEKQVELKDIYFRYPNTDVDVMKGVSLKINRNESVAFVGESGAGKSTLLDILLGLLEPQSGGVLMDGHNIKDIPFAWARTIGYVPQTVYLMDDTIRKNVAFGIDEKDIDDEMIYKALKEAQLYDFVKELPEGLDTVVGERGIRFSGGQRQRISIARALYHNPEILVLDEATSALDNETEKEVMKAIDDLHGKMTIVIVAHRLSTIENCDTVYVVENGRALRRP